MARTPRIVIPNMPHHVICRGNNRRRLFSWTSDYRNFLWYLSCALSNTECLVHQLTLMSNHVHLIVTPPEAGSLARFVKIFSQRYASYRNRRRDGSGKLFEERFESKVIETTDQLAVTTVYNDSNAYRAGIVAEPDDHRWSTCALHTGHPRKTSVPSVLWTPSPWYLGLGRDAPTRAVAYRRFLARYLAGKARADVPPALDVTEEETPADRYTRRLERPDRKRVR